MHVFESRSDLWNSSSLVYSGGRMLAYEQLRESVLGRSEDGVFPVWWGKHLWNMKQDSDSSLNRRDQHVSCDVYRKAVIGSMISGALGQFIASPTDLVKVQMQMEGRRRLEGKPPRWGIDLKE